MCPRRVWTRGRALFGSRSKHAPVSMKHWRAGSRGKTWRTTQTCSSAFSALKISQNLESAASLELCCCCVFGLGRALCDEGPPSCSEAPPSPEPAKTTRIAWTHSLTLSLDPATAHQHSPEHETWARAWWQILINIAYTESPFKAFHYSWAGFFHSYWCIGYFMLFCFFTSISACQNAVCYEHIQICFLT